MAEFDTPKAKPFCYISSRGTLRAWLLRIRSMVCSQPVSTKIHSSKDSRHNLHFTPQEDVKLPEF